MTYDDDIQNLSANETIHDVLARVNSGVSRRNIIRGGVGLAAVPAMAFLPACGGSDEVLATTPAVKKTLTHTAVDKSTLDNVILPAGYTYTIVHATGDRLDSALPAYTNKGGEADDWSRRVGDHHDGMDIFYVDAAGKYSAKETSRAVLVMNHESSADAHFFNPRGQTSNGASGKKFTQFGNWDLGTRPQDEALKEINQHGVSIVELTRTGTVSSYKLDAALNRRVTAQTAMRVTGPAQHLADIQSFMVTAYDTAGFGTRGTLNNCGHGKTPWGTYLACEENWAFYFAMPKGSNPVDAKTIASRTRYGVPAVPLAATATAAASQGWNTVSSTDNRFTRWDISATGATAAQDFRNEPNTFGFVVEIDPLSPNATPAKRVAMGRFAHEAAVCSVPKVGAPLAFYMGCDSQNEYIYKFVSTATWSEADIGGGLTAGNKYLNEGKMYVAKFNADGSGQWLELSINDAKIKAHTAYTFANQADVLINARHAADAVGATKMDRPEWGAVNPANGEIYFTLTNNSSRTATNADAANPRAYADVDGLKRSGNPNGHIIRFKETDGSPTALGFKWDIFLFGSEEDAGATNLSGLTLKNSFSSPDGLWFSAVTGICWIQTDDGAYIDETNCMLVAAIPGSVGDGVKLTVNNNFNSITSARDTFIGAALGEAQLRRFLVGPKGSEVTGITETADGKTLFVNIQHPGESTSALGTATDFTYQSQWPGNQGYGIAGRPRSATIAITRTDGGVIGA